jgi:amino acid adenylation domain-containing protein
MTSKDYNLVTSFARQAGVQPGAAALFIEGQTYTYDTLAERAAHIAGWIHQRAGENATPRIGILASRSLTAYAGILGATWAGATYVPLNPGFPSSRLRQILAQAELHALIIDHNGLRHLEELQQHLPHDKLFPWPNTPPPTGCDTLEGVHPCLLPVKLEQHALAYLMFTSGTTGQPKGISVTVGNVQHMLTTLQARYRIGPNDRLSQFFELSFDPSVFDIFMAFSTGASLHVVPESQLTAPARFIREQQLSIWSSVPSLVGMLGQINLLKPGCFPTLRTSLFCGEALSTASAELWRQAAPNSRVENLYGNTETTVHCMMQDCAETDISTHNRGIVAIGEPLPGLHAAIVDEKQQFLKSGIEGELAISGPQVTPGYLHQPELTAARFPTLEHPTLGPSRWYLTGDLSRQDEIGRFHFLGRIDNQVQLRGHRIELDEIEFHLRKASGCDNSIALFVESVNAAEQQIIGVINHPELDAGEIRDRMRALVPGYMVPKRILCLEELPRSASGKIDRQACLRLAQERIQKELAAQRS